MDESPKLLLIGFAIIIIMVELFMFGTSIIWNHMDVPAVIEDQ